MKHLLITILFVFLLLAGCAAKTGIDPGLHRSTQNIYESTQEYYNNLEGHDEYLEEEVKPLLDESRDLIDEMQKMERGDASNARARVMELIREAKQKMLKL